MSDRKQARGKLDTERLARLSLPVRRLRVLLEGWLRSVRGHCHPWCNLLDSSEPRKQHAPRFPSDLSSDSGDPVLSREACRQPFHCLELKTWRVDSLSRSSIVFVATASGSSKGTSTPRSSSKSSIACK